MQRRHRFLPATLTMALLTGCAGTMTPIPEPGSKAARTYTDHCQACHALPHPARLTARQWDHMLAIMQQRMRERGLPPLDEPTFATIQGYLHRHARP